MSRRGALRVMHRPTRRYSRAELEAVLERRSAESTPLDALVGAACKPARANESSGLGAAMTALHVGIWSHANGPTPAPRRRPVRAFAARVVAVKVMVAAFAMATLGSFAYAAASGNLPGIEHNGGTPTAHAAQSTSAASVQSSAAGRDVTTSSHSRGLAPAVASPTVVPIMRGLCIGWQAAATDPARAGEARFASLVRVAGSAGLVDAYCGVVLSEVPAPDSSTGASGSTPGHTGIQSGRPSGVGNPSHTPGGPNTTHPHGKPSTSAKPTHPAGAPTHPAG